MVREFDVAPASLIIASATPAWTSSLKPPNAPSHSAMMPSLMPSPSVDPPVSGAAVSGAAVSGAAVSGAAVSGRRRGLRRRVTTGVCLGGRAASSSSSSPQAEATRASEIKTPKHHLSLAGSLLSGHSGNPPHLCWKRRIAFFGSQAGCGHDVFARTSPSIGPGRRGRWAGAIGGRSGGSCRAL